MASISNPQWFERKTNESELAHQMRIRSYLHLIDNDENNTAQAEIEQQAAMHRAATGVGVGICGDADASQVSQQTGYGSRGMGSGRQIEKLGHLGAERSLASRIPTDRTTIAQAAREHESQQRQILAQNRPQLRGSSGEGWTTSRG